MSHERTVDAIWAEWICEVLGERLHDIRSTLRDLGIRQADLSKSTPGQRIAFSKYSALINRAAIELDDPYLGLHLGNQIDLKRGGLLSYIMLNTHTLGQAILNRTRYRRIHSDVVDGSVERNDKWWRASYYFLDPEIRGDRLIIDGYLAADLQTVRILTGIELMPLRVQIAYPEIEDPSEHKKVFGCPIEFNANENAVLYEAPTFELPVKSPDERLLHILESYAEEILAKRHVGEIDPVIQEAREIIANFLPTDRKPTIERVSKDMNMSARTLARRLSGEGITFRELVESLRHNLAERYLKDQEISLAQVAFLLGYSNQESFHRAFKRWSGQTPTQFKNDMI